MPDPIPKQRKKLAIPKKKEEIGRAVGPRVLWGEPHKLGMTPEEFKAEAAKVGGLPEGFSFIQVSERYAGGGLKVKIPKKGGGFELIPMNKYNDPYNISKLRNPTLGYYLTKDINTGIAVGYGADIRGFMRHFKVDRHTAEMIMKKREESKPDLKEKMLEEMRLRKAQGRLWLGI